MNKKILKNTKNWTKLALVLSLICSICSINALAQEQMNAKALAALIVELKEVISKNARNENDATLIGKKWDARKDLSGKNRVDVIELLFEDVKSVITDSGVQYQIYSIFSFYGTIPDDFKPTNENADSVKKIRLKNPASVKGEIGGESHNSYVIRVRKNQTLKVQIAWEEKGERIAQFFVSPSNDFFEGKSIRGISTYNEKNWYSKIMKTGDYYIYVTAHPVANYTLKVSIK